MQSKRESTRSSRSQWLSTGPVCGSIFKACKDAQAKNLSLVNGFCWRYDGPRRQTMKRVMDGQIGDIVAIETTYNSQGVWEPRKTREQCASDMEYQMRNWYYYSWLSGDHIVEQAVHGIDTMAWVMNDKPPVKCWGVGGRQSRTDAKYGNIWDHFSVVYEYPENVRGYHHCRHWVNTPPQVKDYVLGTKGTADVFGNSITGPNKWRYRGQNRSNPACTRSSTMKCSPRSAPASRSTTARRPPEARSWP